MRLICVEEHAIDRSIAEAASERLDQEAPYMRLQSSPGSSQRNASDVRPRVVEMPEAFRLGSDLGEGRIHKMDEHGIDMQIVSYCNPAQLVPKEQALTLTRAANDRLAAAVAANPDRLQGLAALPWQSPDEACAEAKRAVTELGLRGVLILGRPGSDFLDASRYADVLRTIESLNVPLFVHPFTPVPQVQQSYYAGLRDEVSAQFSLGGWGWHHEAGIHLLRMILSGVFDRMPRLQIISGHWGEMIPFFLQRLDQILPTSLTKIEDSISDTFRRNVWVAPSGIFHKAHFDFVREIVGLDRVIWAVDYPFIELDGTRDFLDELNLTEAEKRQVMHSNAERLFDLPAAGVV